jgi:hypothetical protein
MRKWLIIIMFLGLLRFLFSDETSDNKKQSFKEAQREYETNHPAFMQKGGMMRPGESAFYIRTDDEWTGFSTVIAGYRFAPSEWFNIAAEGGASLVPNVYIAAVVLHFMFFETPNKLFFFGMRQQIGYKYQDSDFSAPGWQVIVGKNYLTLKRNGFYLISDLTASFRFGPYRRFAVYYSIYPRIDFDFFNQDYPIFFLFSPVMVGFEVRFPKRAFGWSFAAEAGYAFPIPWNSIPAGKWVNFPSLANISFNYRFGDKFYSKENRAKYED